MDELRRLKKELEDIITLSKSSCSEVMITAKEMKSWLDARYRIHEDDDLRCRECINEGIKIAIRAIDRML